MAVLSLNFERLQREELKEPAPVACPKITCRKQDEKETMLKQKRELEAR
jgi:hypothetical protein